MGSHGNEDGKTRKTPVGDGRQPAVRRKARTRASEPAAAATSARPGRRGEAHEVTRAAAVAGAEARRAARGAGRRRQPGGELALTGGAVDEPGAARRERREQVVGVPAQRLLRGEVAGDPRAPPPRGAADVGVPAALEGHGPERADGHRRAPRHVGEDDVEPRARRRAEHDGARRASRRPQIGRRDAAGRLARARRRLAPREAPRARRHPAAARLAARAEVRAAPAHDRAPHGRAAHAARLAGALVHAQHLLEAAARRRPGPRSSRSRSLRGRCRPAGSRAGPRAGAAPHAAPRSRPRAAGAGARGTAPRRRRCCRRRRCAAGP